MMIKTDIGLHAEIMLYFDEVTVVPEHKFGSSILV